MFYFAYGSNMSRGLMQKHCPDGQPMGRARLSGWRFIISGDGYASIVGACGAEVHGILWRLTPRDLAVLNAYESLDSGLYVRRYLPVRHEGGTTRALVYVGRNHHGGRPKPGYHDGIVLPAAREWAFPARYLRQLERWMLCSPRTPRSPSA